VQTELTKVSGFRQVKTFDSPLLNKIVLVTRQYISLSQENQPNSRALSNFYQVPLMFCKIRIETTTNIVGIRGFEWYLDPYCWTSDQIILLQFDVISVSETDEILETNKILMLKTIISDSIVLLKMDRTP
jgi:hypothetical protein